MNTQRKAPTPTTGTRATSNDIANNSIAARQRKIILAYLLEGNHLTTIYAREHMGIMHPGGRVLELRDEGRNIRTHWAYERDTAGNKHRIASYVLIRSKEAVNA